MSSSDVHKLALSCLLLFHAKLANLSDGIKVKTLEQPKNYKTIRTTYRKVYHLRTLAHTLIFRSLMKFR